MANNGASYQKSDGTAYHEIGNSSPTNGGAASSGGGAGKRKWILGIGVLGVIAVVFGVYFSGNYGGSAGRARAFHKATLKKQVDYSGAKTNADGTLKLFDDLNRYVLEDYDARSNFASFLPGVAGYFGKPVWAFYVNRGQGLSTFGTESKDYPILEFNSANKAYQLTPFVGFRTFVRGTRSGSGSGSSGGTSFNVEPFSSSTTRDIQDNDDDVDKPKRIMFVGTNELEIQEMDHVNGLSTKVQYFILPEEDFASLVRRTTFTNNGNDDLTLSLMDGLARMEPYGGKLDWGLKGMGRTLEGWMGVYHADDTLNMPFYKLSTEPTDAASVTIEVAGHYCLAFVESETKQAGLLPIIYDSSKVFGQGTAMDIPYALLATSVEDILEKPQYGWAKTSSAFAALASVTLKPGENITIASVYGKSSSIEYLDKIAATITVPGYINTKFQRARSITNELTAGVETTTVNPLFDGTVKQMFLDNGLRGGFPTVMGLVDSDATYDEDDRVKIFHSFSRIHGDQERDYNAFSIDPTFYSQGPGNYRDIAQNRRNDVTFYPRMGSFDIQMFLSYIQADGYEPLTVEAVVFRYDDKKKAQKVADLVTNDANSSETLCNVLKGGPFRPGQLFALIDQLHINLKVSRTDFINEILAEAEDRAMAVYGSGYWADHWDYYMDFIEAYLAVFPDGEEELMYDKPLRYFFSTATVKPRSQKYVLQLTYNASGYHVQQLDSTYFDGEKAKEQDAFRNQNTGLIGIESNWQRTAEGTAFMSSAIAKLFLLGSIKYAMRDAWGMGVEYEGGRPGWLDSMNGLPGMVGSGMPETYEMLLLLKYVKKVVGKYKRPVVVPSEAAKMIKSVNEALDDLLHNYPKDSPEDFTQDVPDPLFEYWDIVAAARENYRNDVQYYFSGNETALEADDIVDMITRWIHQIEIGIKRSFEVATIGFGDDGTSGIPATFFAYEVTTWELNKNRNSVGLPLVNAKSMRVKKFPLFLEGPVRYMKTIQDDPKRMKDIYERVLTSGLRDENLKMYYLSSSLTGQSYDMGRQIAFAPGWLENQSIWLHMSYKYYLQLLRGKLYDQFFSEMKGGGMLPFMDPNVYGRSLMECSSFIASSAFPDPSIVGQGFLARLSGSTAEFLDIWKLMFIGPKLYYMDRKNKLVMEFTPALPSWLFKDEDNKDKARYDDDGNLVISFKLFAAIDVTYHNPSGGDLYGVSPKSYKITMNEGSGVYIDGPVIPTETAIAIRKMKDVKAIDAYF